MKVTRIKNWRLLPVQAQIDPSDYQAQATGTRQRLERQAKAVRRLKAAIKAISSVWRADQTLGKIHAAISAAEAIADEIESEVV